MVKLKITRNELYMGDENFCIPKTVELEGNIKLVDGAKKIVKEYKLPKGYIWDDVWVLQDKSEREIFVYYDDQHIFYANPDITIAELYKSSKYFNFAYYDKYYFRRNCLNVRKKYINYEEEKYANFLKHKIVYRFFNFINETLCKLFFKD